MGDIQLGVIESRFADMIWANEPVKSTVLVKLAEKEFNWKRTTTHTVIKRLCEKGLFGNNSGTVTAVLTREQFYTGQSRQFVKSSFSGSLPAFRQGGFHQDVQGLSRSFLKTLFRLKKSLLRDFL